MSQDTKPALRSVSDSGSATSRAPSAPCCWSVRSPSRTCPVRGQYEVFLLGQILAFAIAALAYNVLLGYTGLLSFGHAAFFGGSAYAAGLAMQYYGMTELLLLIPLGVLVAGTIAVVIGFISVRHTEVYYALLKLPHGVGYAGYLMGILYYVILLSFVVTVVLLWTFMHSPFGLTLKTIRDDPERARAIGIPVRRYRWYASIMSGLFTGLGA